MIWLRTHKQWPIRFSSGLVWQADLCRLNFSTFLDKKKKVNSNCACYKNLNIVSVWYSNTWTNILEIEEKKKHFFFPTHKQPYALCWPINRMPIQYRSQLAILASHAETWEMYCLCGFVFFFCSDDYRWCLARNKIIFSFFKFRLIFS